MEKILVVCLNPTFQRTMVFENFLEGEVNRSGHYRFDASGKGVNVARIIAQLGGKPIHITHVGGSRMDEFIHMVKADGIEVFWTDSQSPIRTCTTIIHANKETTTELVEEPIAVSSGTDKKIRALFTEALKEVATVVISGTRTSGYSPSLYPDFVKEAKEAGKRVILDVKGSDLVDSLTFGVDLVKPNLSEFATTFIPGLMVLEQEDSSDIRGKIQRKLEQLHTQYGTAILLTRGAYAVWLQDDTGFSEIPIEQVKAVNTIGCGDAVTAGIAYSLTNGDSFYEAVKIGLACGVANARNLRPGSIEKEEN